MRGNIEEKEMFHGTHADVIDNIAEFDPSKNTVSAFGKGTYFAKKASYSYMKSHYDYGISYIILANVLIGNIGRMRNNETINTERYDNSICVTPYADGAYPKYVISFHKTAV